MVRATLRRLLALFPALLGRLGLVDRQKAGEAFDLAVPVMVTGGMRVAIRAADFVMVGLAVGDAAIAGLELGYQYYFLGFGLSLAATSGTISVVSRLQGAGERARANLAVKQSLWLSLLLSVPLAVVTWFYAEPMVGVLTDDPDVIGLGGRYLSVIMLALPARFWSMVAARALAGSADTRTPMYVRTLSVPTNVVLNAILIFGLFGVPKLGVTGAALGTAIANVLAATVFFALLVSGRYDVTLRLGGRQVDAALLAEIVRVALPLAGMRIAQTFGRFPLLFVLGVLGTPAVAAFAIGRRVMLFALMPA
jgi:putative MATE family efflux protein